MKVKICHEIHQPLCLTGYLSQRLILSFWGRYRYNCLFLTLPRDERRAKEKIKLRNRSSSIKTNTLIWICMPFQLQIRLGWENKPIIGEFFKYLTTWSDAWKWSTVEEFRNWLRWPTTNEILRPVWVMYKRPMNLL